MFEERNNDLNLAKIFVGVRRNATDLLPMDLEGRFELKNCTLTFNWRNYLCTYFDEMRAIDVMRPSNDQSVEATTMGNAVRTGEMSMEDALTADYNASMGLHDDKVRTVRRRRRLRIGLKHEQWLRDAEPYKQAEYVKLMEDQVLKRKEEREMEYNCLEFSDSEGGDDHPPSEGDDKEIIEGGEAESDWEDDEDDDEVHYFGPEEDDVGGLFDSDDDGGYDYMNEGVPSWAEYQFPDRS